MTDPLLCDKCGQEIKPGQKVNMIGLDDLAERRIIVDDQPLVVHADPAECEPEPA